MNGLGRKKENKENDQIVFTRETLGVVLILFATLCLICLITREALFSYIGQAVNAFLFGCFGFFAYAVTVFVMAIGVMLISGKKTGFSKKKKWLTTLIFFTVALISHIATIGSAGYSYGEYISESYRMGAGGLATASAGGLFTALAAYVFSALLTSVGSYVILGIALVGMGYALIRDFVNAPAKVNKGEGSKFRSSYVKNDGEDVGLDIAGTKEYPIEGVDFSAPSGKQKLFVNNPYDFSVKNKREMHKEANNPTGVAGMKFGFADGGLGVVDTGTETKKVTRTDDFNSKLDYIKTPASFDMDKYLADSEANSRRTYSNVGTYKAPSNGGTYTSVSGYVNPRKQKDEEAKKDENIPFIEHESSPSVSNIVTGNSDTAEARAEIFGNKYADVQETEKTEEIFSPAVEAKEDIFRPVEIKEQSEEIPFIDETEETKNSDSFSQTRSERTFGIRSEEKEEDKTVEDNVVPPASAITNTRRIRGIFFGDENSDDSVREQTEEKNDEKLGFSSRVAADDNSGSRRGFGEQLAAKEEKPIEQEKPKKPAPPINREYFRPPFDLLETYSQPISAVQENHQERMEIIQRTLEDFHINAVPQSYVQGPSITRYEIMMPAGISVKKVLNYDDDLKMRLAAKDGVRIEAPIPGKNLVGVEVANSVKVTVGLKEVMEGLAGKKSKPTALMFAVGKDIVGNSISYDLAKGPHYLIAGATGSGKSVCLHVMIVSLLMRYSPEELKLVLVDPKSVEFRKYEHIPHLLVDEIVTEPKRALTLLQWAYEETNRRNEMFTECGGMISNIDDYNTQIASETVPKLPRIVFVIDELADLMESCKKDLEARIRMIAAKSRSAGIHLVLATQRPSVDVITGTIKANLPSRIALKVMNFADSQTILGEAGAEKLLGNGDMLYKDSSMGDYERYQGAYISGREITNIVNYIKEHNQAYFDDDIQEFLDKETKPKQEEGPAEQGGDNGGDNIENDTFFLKALWLAVNSESVSISLLQRRFQIGYARAGGLVDKMERLGFVSGNEGSKARRVLLSKEEFIGRFGPMDEAY